MAIEDEDVVLIGEAPPPIPTKVRIGGARLAIDIPIIDENGIEIPGKSLRVVLSRASGQVPLAIRTLAKDLITAVLRWQNKTA